MNENYISGFTLMAQDFKNKRINNIFNFQFYKDKIQKKIDLLLLKHIKKKEILKRISAFKTYT